MKIRTRKYTSRIPEHQERIYAKGHYRNYNEYPSNHSRDYYRPNRAYGAYSRYKYPDYSRDPVRSNKRKYPSRPASPVQGSEEYMMKKIQETSAIIMKQLLNPNDQSSDKIEQPNENSKENCTVNSPTTSNTSESTTSVNSCKSKNKKNATYNIQEIHEKIMHHITKLNDGRKKNLINSNMSGYDAFIERVQKQKRLEISQAIRDMCSQPDTAQESSNFINSIIPDIGIKIEDLPHNLLEELRNTLDLDLEFSDNLNCDLRRNIKPIGTDERYTKEIPRTYDFTSDEPLPKIFIKSEPHDSCSYYAQSNSCIELNDTNSDHNLNNTSDCHNNISKVGCSNNENSTITIKTEVCEEIQSELPNTSQTVNDDLQKHIKEEVQEPSEYNCFLNANCGTTQNLENYENHNMELSAPNVPIFATQKTTCNISEKDINSQTNSNTNLTESNPLLTVRNKELETTKEGPEIGTKQNSSVKNSCTDVSTQTDEDQEIHFAGEFVDILLSKHYKENPKNISETVNRMFEIDQCISKLTVYRQSLFANLNGGNDTNVQTGISNENITEHNAQCSLQSEMVLPKKHKKKKKKAQTKNTIIDKCQNTEIVQKSKIENDTTISKQHSSKTTKKSNKKNKKDKINILSKRDTLNKHTLKNDKSDDQSTNCINNKKPLELVDVHEKVLVIKFVDDKLVAGTETGKMIFFKLETGQCSTVLQISHLPITSLLYVKNDQGIGCMYTGSFDTFLKIYNCNNCSLIENVPLDDRIQCMECNWGHIFIGCMGGSLMRYSLKKKMVEYEDKFSDTTILVLKAAQEGARRVLLVGSRNMPVCIRDAMTGLYMRTMEDVISPTVYSLVLEKNLVYCGTTNHDILVYSFNDGKFFKRFKPTDSKGIGCMKIDGNLLFASCHNGNIYAYDIKKNVFIDFMEGPGGVILSMEIFKNQVVVGTMSFKFVSLPIPQHILQHKV